jgi:hypothetical protein
MVVMGNAQLPFPIVRLIAGKPTVSIHLHEVVPTSYLHLYCPSNDGSSAPRIGHGAGKRPW